MEESKTCSTLIEVLSKSHTKQYVDRTESDVPYRQAIENLMYLMISTPPDIEITVGNLSQYCEDLLIHHWKLFMRVMRYINGTKNNVYTLKSSKAFVPIGYYDSDWAWCTKTINST